MHVHFIFFQHRGGLLDVSKTFWTIWKVVIFFLLQTSSSSSVVGRSDFSRLSPTSFLLPINEAGMPCTLQVVASLQGVNGILQRVEQAEIVNIYIYTTAGISRLDSFILK